METPTTTKTYTTSNLFFWNLALLVFLPKRREKQKAVVPLEITLQQVKSWYQEMPPYPTAFSTPYNGFFVLCTSLDTSSALLCHHQHKWKVSPGIKWIDNDELSVKSGHENKEMENRILPWDIDQIKWE